MQKQAKKPGTQYLHEEVQMQQQLLASKFQQAEELSIELEKVELQCRLNAKILKDTQQLHSTNLDQLFELQSNFKILTLKLQQLNKKIQELKIENLTQSRKNTKFLEKQILTDKKIKILQKQREFNLNHLIQKTELNDNYRNQIVGLNAQKKAYQVQKNRMTLEIQRLRYIHNKNEQYHRNYIKPQLALMKQEIEALRIENTKLQQEKKKIHNEKNEQILQLQREIASYKNQKNDKDINQSCYKNTADSEF